MKIANRMNTLTRGGNDGWDVFYRARKMKLSGLPVTELTVGEHDIGTHKSILTEMDRSAKAGNTGYASVPGTDELRQTVAQRIKKKTGVPTTAANILITPGGQAALFAAHLSVLDAGDVALYFDPYYATYPGTLRGVGAVDRPINCYPENNFQPLKSDIELAAK